MHLRCVVLAAEERIQGHLIHEEEAKAHLAILWEKKGPRNHPYEAMYQRQAVLLVTRAVDRIAKAKEYTPQEAWEIPLTYGRIKFTPDVIEFVECTSVPSIVVQRVRTGRFSQSEMKKDIYALYQQGAEQAFPTARRKIQVVSLSDDRIEEVPPLGKKAMTTRLTRYDVAMSNILQKDYPAQPQERECPRCPYYFICPSAEDV